MADAKVKWMGHQNVADHFCMPSNTFQLAEAYAREIHRCTMYSTVRVYVYKHDIKVIFRFEIEFVCTHTHTTKWPQHAFPINHSHYWVFVTSISNVEMATQHKNLWTPLCNCNIYFYSLPLPRPLSLLCTHNVCDCVHDDNAMNMMRKLDHPNTSDRYHCQLLIR